MIKKVRIIAAVIIAVFGIAIAVSNFVLGRKRIQDKMVDVATRTIEKKIFQD